MTFGTSVEELQARLDASPFNAWLGTFYIPTDKSTSPAS
jgi:hypothetical protein